MVTENVDDALHKSGILLCAASVKTRIIQRLVDRGGIMKTVPVSSHQPARVASRGSSRTCIAVRSEIRFLLKASRPGFWLTAGWFYLLPLGANAPLDSASFWLGLFYVGFPLGMLIYAGNDLTDAKTDALNPRKDSWLFGARPSTSQIRELPQRIFLVQAPFVALFTLLIGPRALLWFGATLVASLLYNWRNGTKDRPILDVLAQVGYLLVFVLSSWMCGLPLAPWPIWVFGALFAMHSHLFGQIMDIEPDARAGRRTTAVCIGARRAKLIIATLLCIESLLALCITTKPWLAPILVISAVWFVLDEAILWKDKPYATWQARLFFLGWNLFLLAETALSFLFWRGLFG
jgi:4-hydroxybenzoate polyprenyltransferase